MANHAATSSQEASAASSLPWGRVTHEARKRFGIRGFRPGQRELLEAVFAGRDAIGVLPTGAGKSLTYQLPALFLAKPILVVSPLIALMQDQQERAADAEIAVERLDSTVTKTGAEAASEEIDAGKAQLIYTTPEHLEDRAFLDELNGAGGVSLFVVDEAHCIAQWGHDFRPAYLNLGFARRKLGDPAVLALTATATPQVLEEIRSVLSIADAELVMTSTERENLHLAVHPTVNLDAKLARLGELLEAERGNSGIVYTASIKTAEMLYGWLREHGFAAGRYHGKLSAQEREREQEEFMRGQGRVIVATKAFGLGVDKADIRFVYHFEFPDSLESYAQEAGRAGRDGEAARAVLLYRLEDKRIQSYFLGGRYPKLEEAQAVMAALRTAALEDGSKPLPLAAKTIAEQSGVGQRRTQVLLYLLAEAGVVKHGRKGYRLRREAGEEELAVLVREFEGRAVRDKERLAEMMHYAETVGCRTQVLRAYFGEEPGNPCGRCDNCERGAEHEAALAEAAAAEKKLRRSRGRGKAAGASARAYKDHDRMLTVQGVAEKDAHGTTVIETMHGIIHTTAPETLVRSEPEAFRPGDFVRHKTFGVGEVRDVHAGNALVHFAKGGNKRIAVSFLKAVRS